MVKTFILDTNVLIHDPSCFKVFQDNEIVIPISVLDELDNIKTRLDESGRNARDAVRLLDSLRAHGTLSEGVPFGNSTIRVELNHCSFIPDGLSDKVDNRILSVALGLKKENKDVRIITKDINLRVKCDALGIDAEDYNSNKLTSEAEQIYSGVKTLYVPSTLIDQLYQDKFLIMNEEEMFPNQFFILKSDSNESQSAITRCIEGKLIPIKKIKGGVSDICPRNIEQEMAFNLLLDPNIKLVTITGRAGGGKTLLSAAAGVYHITKTKNKVFERMLISRPIQPMGRELGYIPGTIEDKMAPWMQPIYDNLELILGSDHVMINEYKDQGIIQVEPLTYIRGRSIPNSFFIVDETQNLTPKEIKTIISRLGENSKIVLTGDVEQIDNLYVDFADNGLTHAIEKFKYYDIAGHITLTKGERSPIATLAASIL